MAALIAAAAEPVPDFPLVSLSSEGVTLVYGRDERAIEAARLLAEHLDVTVLITRPKDLSPPRVTEFPVVKGTIRSAKGHLGAFELAVDDYAAPAPSSRGVLTFGMPRDGAVSRCDLIIDLSGGAPLFPAHDLRDGYLRADPDDAGRGAACRAQGARPHRHLRQAALRGIYRRALRALALAHRRLPPLPRPLPDRRDHAGRQSCVDRSERLRRLRPMRRGLPDRCCRLRAAARRHAAAQAARAAHDLRASRWRARDRVAARRAARFAADRGARAPRRRPAGERAAAFGQRGDAGRARGGRRRVCLWGIGAAFSHSRQAAPRCGRAAPRRSRSPTRSWPGSASARAASPPSRPTIRSRSATPCARSKRRTARRVPPLSPRSARSATCCGLRCANCIMRRPRRSISCRCPRAHRSARCCSTPKAARSASPASRRARPARCPTSRTGRCCASPRMPACSAGCARRRAPRR